MEALAETGAPLLFAQDIRAAAPRLVDIDEPIAANKATYHLGRSTGDDIGELMIAASKATGTEAPLATNAPYRRSGVSQ